MTTHPWHRQRGETARAFAAFAEYLRLGPERTILDAYRQTSGNASARTVPGYFGAWSARWDWPGRAAAWDTHRLEAELDAAGAKRARVRLSLLARAQAVADRLVTLATDPTAEFGAHHVAAARLVLQVAGVEEPTGKPASASVRVEGGGSDAPTVVVHLVAPDNGRGPRGEDGE